MAALIYSQNIQKAFGAKQLFHGVTFGIGEQERIGIIGPNGSGKSTFLKILAGLETPDHGTVTRRQHIRVAYIPQDPKFTAESTVVEVLNDSTRRSGLSPAAEQAKIYEILGKVGFADESQSVGVLSGGWKKRLAIAGGLVQNPDVMLLDEPTNHMDEKGLRWLAQFMVQAPWAWVLVSHDRWFLETTTNKMAELHSRYADGLLMYPGNYSEFLEKREAFQLVQAQQVQALAGKVRREEAWLRRGPKARTTKAKYRVETAKALQSELASTTTRLRQQDIELNFVGSGRKTRQLIEVTGLAKAFGSQPIIRHLNMVITPGRAVGIIGQNGTGKSTLLKLLAKTIDPDAGTVKYADNLKVVYFDQHRAQLDPELTLKRTLADSGDSVTYRGHSIHLVGWAKRFGFRSEQLDLPVKLLSGGEQARAALARFMLQPADVLIVDEPTNDLDIPTREILEESFSDFEGGLVLVTHDRYMLEHVCTEFVGLDSDGVHEHFASYAQWESWLDRERFGFQQEKKTFKGSTGSQHSVSPKKLSYKEQQEYDNIETTIFDAEQVRHAYRAKVDEPAVASDHLLLQEAYEGLKKAEQEVERLYARWAELDAKVQAYANRGTGHGGRP